MVVFQQWEKLNEKIVFCFLRLLRTEECEKNMEQRITYSLKVLLSEFQKFFILIFLFGMLHRLMEFFIVFLSIIPIRVFMGGSHRKTMLGCFLQSVIVFSIAILLALNLEMKQELQWIVHGILLIEIWISTPLQSTCRITYNKEQRIKFKAKAMTVLLILSWIEQILPVSYRKQVGFALLVLSVEIIISCIQIKRKEVVNNEERDERKIK